MINYVEKLGIQNHLVNLGFTITQVDNVWESDDDHTAINAAIAAYDPLPLAKVQKIFLIKIEANRRAGISFAFDFKDNELENVNGEYLNLNLYFQLESFAEMWASITGTKSATTRTQFLLDVYTASENAITAINASGSIAFVTSYNVETDPAWPV